jgi:hypothetical protein
VSMTCACSCHACTALLSTTAAPECALEAAVCVFRVTRACAWRGLTPGLFTHAVLLSWAGCVHSLHATAAAAVHQREQSVSVAHPGWSCTCCCAHCTQPCGCHSDEHTCASRVQASLYTHMHRRLHRYKCADGKFRRMRLSLFVYAADMMEMVNVLHLRPWSWQSTTPTDIFTMAAPSQLDDPDPQPPPQRRTQALMQQVRPACCTERLESGWQEQSLAGGNALLAPVPF